MQVITTYFNPCGYKSKLKNYNTFRNSIEKVGAKLLTIEMSNYESNFQIKDSIKFKGDCFLWQKENLIAKGMDIIEEDIFAWIDCDIIFEDDNWIEKTIESLKTNEIVQMFRNVTFLNPDGREDKKFKSMFSEFYHNPLFAKGYPNQGHPGFAFAGRKDKISFYKGFILSDDVVFCSSLTHDYWIIKSWDVKDEIKNDIINWCESIKNIRFSFVDLNIKHLWHGSWKNRQYNSRMKLINKHSNKIKTKNGLNFCDDKETIEDLMNFFSQRKEDLIMFI